MDEENKEREQMKTESGQKAMLSEGELEKGPASCAGTTWK